MKGCGVKAIKAASQATYSDRALLPTSVRQAACRDTLMLYTRCVKNHFSETFKVGG